MGSRGIVTDFSVVDIIVYDLSAEPSTVTVVQALGKIPVVQSLVGG